MKNVTAKTDKDMKTHMKIKHQEKYNCTPCKLEFTTQGSLVRHQKISHNKKVELICDECQFQASTGPELRKHLNTLNHKASTEIDMNTLGDTFKCKECSEEFSDFWNLMNHRRDLHPEKRRRCRNDLKGECDFADSGPNGCWWRHMTKSSRLTNLNQVSKETCNICEESFSRKSEVMIHKKVNHEESVPICHDFRDGNCEYPQERCWYRHYIGEKRNNPTSQHDTIPSPEDFPRLPEQTKPPEAAIKTSVNVSELEQMVKRALQLIMNVDGKLKQMRF